MKNLLIILIFNSLFTINLNSQYCTPAYTNPCFNPWSTNDMIDNFWTTGGLTDISNLSSGCATSASNNYSPFLNLFLVTVPGANINFNVQGAVFGQGGVVCNDPTGTQSGCFEQGFAIWVDWNQDFDFTDPGEKIYESPTPGHQVFTGSFTVPQNVNCGDYRLRVKAVFSVPGASIEACPANPDSFGETEDYTITITNCRTQTRTICEGETAAIDYTNGIPANTNSVVVNPMTNVSIALPVISFDPLDSAAYSLTWTSPDSSWIDSVYINVNEPLLQNSISVDDTSCIGDLIPISGTLGNTSTNYFWSAVNALGVVNFVPNTDTLHPSITSNIPGIYQVVFTEVDTNNVCPSVTDTAKFTFSEEIHTTSFNNPTCNGFNDGEITINSNGTLGAVEFSINNGASWSTNNVFSNLPFGVYDIISRDIAGCTFESQVTLVDPDVINISTSNDTTICENGMASIFASSSNATFFNWDFTLSTVGNQFISATGDSTVTVYATNFNNCSSDTLSINIDLYNSISITINGDNTICPEDFTAKSVSAVGGYQNYDYAWTENGIASALASPQININPVIETNYCVTVSDQCESTPKSICSKVFMYPVPVPEFTSEILENCEPNALVAFTITTADSVFDKATVALGPNLVDLVNDPLNSETKSDTVLIPTAGNYDFYLSVTSDKGCEHNITLVDHIIVDPIPSADFYITPERATIFEPVFNLVNLSQGNNITFDWELKGGSPTFSKEVNPTVAYPQSEAGEYPIRLLVTSEAGCIHEADGIAIVENDVVIYAPNSFSPDDDDQNNFWRVYIKGIDQYDYRLQIYSRWGELVFESFDPNASWNGTLASGAKVLSGTYVWVIETRDQSTSEIIDFRGTVNVFK